MKKHGDIKRDLEREKWGRDVYNKTFCIIYFQYTTFTRIIVSMLPVYTICKNFYKFLICLWVHTMLKYSNIIHTFLSFNYDVLVTILCRWKQFKFQAGNGKICKTGVQNVFSLVCDINRNWSTFTLLHNDCTVSKQRVTEIGKCTKYVPFSIQDNNYS